MTPEQLRQLEQAAKDGAAWRCERCGRRSTAPFHGSNQRGNACLSWGHEPCCVVLDDPDAELIAAARNALPALLDVAEAAESIARVACEWHCYGDCDRCRLRAALSRLDTEDGQ